MVNGETGAEFPTWRTKSLFKKVRKQAPNP
jgi:hypothetical protein